MQIKTYTHIWSSPKMFYTLWGWELPKPVSFISVGLFLLLVVIWVPITLMIGLPITSPFTWVIMLGVPGFGAYFGGKPVFEEKSLILYLVSRVAFLQQAKEYSNLAEDKRNKEVNLKGSYWKRREGN